MEVKEVQDEVIGVIRLHRNPRARKYSLRVENGQVIGTLPRHGSEREMLKFVREQREHLQRFLQIAPKRPPFDEQTELQTLTFRLHIFCSERANYYMTLKDGLLHIACPQNTDFSNPAVQETLQRMFRQALRYEARRVLPPHLKMLAERHGFSYTRLTIRQMTSRWGSCTSQRHINLALSLMLLPEYLIDYVMLHELCHTVEMNHSDRFWKMLDGVTNGQSQMLRSELRKQRML